MALHINKARGYAKKLLFFFFWSSAKEKEISRSKAPVKKHFVTKHVVRAHLFVEKKIPPLIADASTNLGQFINTANMHLMVRPSATAKREILQLRPEIGH
ncbi:H/ACA ribonucleoprotein complex subunit Nop10 [Penicillium bovifimosum]|uniref:H/ACA ribonucleoprotein complex subunit Nop10 n=1 Tax=Penicillium bovifimosum TaxID=126998 RepID=A0A9W9L9W0_9EURO|nr:H/ACA ribonucleoprotein complex subunit Nop10 [Penicillium bovifimosum]KAJ5145869.1 H/ACA ribonucleoprotein complex subunit Nop10 [Penicillium bovifimosum]